MPDITSRPFRVDPEKACEACVFGRGEHAEWCEQRKLLDKILRVQEWTFYDAPKFTF